jgi:hypothetical protein
LNLPQALSNAGFADDAAEFLDSHDVPDREYFSVSERFQAKIFPIGNIKPSGRQ